MSGILLVLLLLGTAVPAAGSMVPFDAATKGGDGFDAVFCWRGRKTDVHVTARGALTLKTATTGAGRGTLALQLEKGEYIDWVWLKPYQDDLLILFEASDGERGRGGIYRVRETPFGLRWNGWFPGVNVVGAISRDGSIYVGATGFLGRINAASGRYLWRQHDHRIDRALNILSLPREEGTMVVFEATAAGRPTKVIRLNRKTGRIVEATDKQAFGASGEASPPGLPRRQGRCGATGR